jgi:hypothetical protein
MWNVWERIENCTSLGGKTEGKTLLGRQRRRLEDGIGMDLREIGSEVWSGLTWLRLGTGARLL